MMPTRREHVPHPASQMRDVASPGDSAATVLLSGSDVRRIATIGEVIDATEQAVVELAAGRISSAARVGLPGGGTLLMAASSAERGGVAGKIVSIEPSNRAAGLATIQGLAMWFDYRTRQPLLVADATAVTALRTGALTGVATRALARPEASVLAMVGAGGQALTQVEAVAAVRPIEQVRVVSLQAASALRLCERLSASLPGVRATVAPGIAAAVRDADVVCLATTSATALTEAADLPERVHVNAVGAYRPDMREVGVSVFRAASLVSADDPEGAQREAGDLMDAITAGALAPDTLVELGTVVDRAGREPSWSGGITVFKSVGSAAADLALLALLMQRAGADPTARIVDFSG